MGFALIKKRKGEERVTLHSPPGATAVGAVLLDFERSEGGGLGACPHEKNREEKGELTR